VVRLPAEVDYVGAEQVSQDLVAAFADGITTVIADFTGCRFCDTAGLGAMVVAYKLATARSVAFRLVVPSKLVRIFALTGLATVLAIYPTLTAALAAGQVPGNPEPARG
jgi:anti-sigma B factor antagonist